MKSLHVEISVATPSIEGKVRDCMWETLGVGIQKGRYAVDYNIEIGSTYSFKD